MDVKDLDYPVPDPAWDYSQIYHNLQQAKKEIEEAIAFISQQEDATIQSDEYLKSQLGTLQVLIEETKGSL